MKILAIETSCDDTSIAIVDCQGDLNNLQFTVLSNVISSQIKIHQKFGGVVPNLASREHAKNILPVLESARRQAKMSYQQIAREIDLIAVTIGPGLIPSLLIGVNFARSLSYFLNKPMVEVNHLAGHLYSCWLSASQKNYHFKVEFPLVTLLVSGGHTQLYYLKNITDIQLMGETRDDASGECFDKIAKILNLGYPGGPEIAKQASQFKSSMLNSKFQVRLPRPMINSNDYDFSFAGLKTAVLYLVEKLKKQKLYNASIKKYICFDAQEAVCEVLTYKTIKLAKDVKAKTILISGGVSANQRLRQMLKEKTEQKLPQAAFYAPEMNFCTDNAAMIASAGYINFLEGKTTN